MNLPVRSLHMRIRLSQLSGSSIYDKAGAVEEESQ
jgi:hypothetical protein